MALEWDSRGDVFDDPTPGSAEVSKPHPAPTDQPSEPAPLGPPDTNTRKILPTPVDHEEIIVRHDNRPMAAVHQGWFAAAILAIALIVVATTKVRIELWVFATLLSGAGWWTLSRHFLDKEIHELETEFGKLSGHGERVICPANSSGGSGKSTITILQAILWSIYSLKEVALADLNNDSGVVVARLGFVKGAILRVSTVHSILKTHGKETLRQMIKNMPRERNRLLLFDREPENSTALRLSQEEVEVTIAAISEEVATTFCDVGTSIIGPDERAAVNQATVVLLVADTGKPDTMVSLATTLQNFENNGAVDLHKRAIAVLMRPWPWPFRRLNDLPGLSPTIPLIYMPRCLHIRFVTTKRAIRFNKISRRLLRQQLKLGIEICKMTPPDKPALSPSLDPNEWVDQILGERRPQGSDKVEPDNTPNITESDSQ